MKKKIRLAESFILTSVLLFLINLLWGELVERAIATLFVACVSMALILHTNAGKALMTCIRGWFAGRLLQGTARNLKVGEKVAFNHPECITIGDSCTVLQNVVFAPVVQYGTVKYPSKIIIGDRVNFGAFDRIASMNEVIIEDDVLFAAFVHVTDHSHEYRKIGVPVKQQGIFGKGPVRIKKGAWLAFGCHILSGVTVGEYSVVAANSVVTKDVPPFSVVAGNPARVVSRYNFESKEWESVKKNENWLVKG